jgi:L-alanine-DL-glutamate epimerase-like enolase superfamily enzyme
MAQLSRRGLLMAAGITAVSQTFAIAVPNSKDIRILDVDHSFENFQYRTPYKFGGMLVDRVTLLNVNCVVENAAGRSAKGFASMPLGNMWSWPSRKLTYDTTLDAMKTLAARASQIMGAYREPGHPIDIGVALEPAYLKAAEETKFAEPMPKLCTLVTTSPFDAAVHDAYGKLYGINCYQTYGPEFMRFDLEHYLGPDYKGKYLSDYVLQQPAARIALYHSVGAADPIVESDIQKPIQDGLPETLPEWIRYNGIKRIKIKLNGDDLAWDVERVVHIDRATSETQAKLGVSEWYYSLDFNERCPNVAYLLDFLRQLKAKTASGFERIQYIEQPTRRDLKSDRQNVMHEAAKLRPVVIDESLTDVETLLLSQEMGYTGAALKVCKGQSQVLLMAAVAQKHKMFLCVQDLTCPGASLVHSATLASHVPGVTAMEANAREYVPIANRPWVDRFPGIFKVRDGFMDTSSLTGPGLGVVG